MRRKYASSYSESLGFVPAEGVVSAYCPSVPPPPPPPPPRPRPPHRRRHSHRAPYDYLIKGVLIGDYGVGKSSIAARFVQDTYEENHVSTIGVDFNTTVISVSPRSASLVTRATEPPRDIVVKLQLWDTAGQERFYSITRAYYRGAYLFILVFSVQDRATFEKVETWLKDVAESAPSRRHVVLVGNKCDATDTAREVTTAEASALAERHGLPYHEVSAKHDRGNIDDLFYAATSSIVDDVGALSRHTESAADMLVGVVRRVRLESAVQPDRSRFGAAVVRCRSAMSCCTG